MEEIRRIRSLVAEITRIMDKDHVSIERLDSITASAERLLRAFVMMLNSNSISRLEDCQSYARHG